MSPATHHDVAADETAERRYLRRVDVRAALVIAAVFNAIVGVVFALAGLIVLAVAVQRGVLDQVNTVTSDLGAAHPVHVNALKLALVWLMIVAGWTVVATALVGFAVVIFNGVLRLLGGVELDLLTRPGDRPDVGAHVRRVLAAVRDRLEALAPEPVPSQLRAESDEAEAFGS